ncbi:hypothetical protein [Neobacillus sp. LXY-4]|uniref:hypothetical protein n=1 Tax=Neobacillus sp. LXY-4 TaxID=3379826 RepID=UPI003EDF76B6
MSRFLVVDACVATSASTKQIPVSKICKNILDEVLKSTHKLVFNQQLQKEWFDHPSKLGIMIFSSMKSRGRIIKIDESGEISHLKEKVLVIKDRSRVPAIMKDMHLIEAALLSDKIIISLDKKARNNFCSILNDVQEISVVNWLNPEEPNENIFLWFSNGANYEESRALRNFVPQTTS